MSYGSLAGCCVEEVGKGWEQESGTAPFSPDLAQTLTLSPPDPTGLKWKE